MPGGQQTCSVHGKLRSLQSLISDGEGGLMCAPGSECKISGSGPTGTSGGAGGGVCSLHGKMRSADSLIDDGWGGVCCAPGKECKMSGASPTTAYGTKRTLCKFWQEGRCNQGAWCTYAHGEEELGAAIPEGASGPTAESDDGSDAMGMSPGMMRAMSMNPMMAMGPMAWKGMGPMAWKGMMGMGMGKGMGKMAAISAMMGKGMGKMAAMMMGKGMGKGMMGMGPMGMPIGMGPMSMMGMGGGGGGSSAAAWSASGPSSGGTCVVHGKVRSGNCLMDLGDGTFQCKPGMECKEGVSSSGASAVAPKRTPCKFFATGNCKKGDSCTFSHDDASAVVGFGDMEGYGSMGGKGWAKAMMGAGAARYSPY